MASKGRYGPVALEPRDPDGGGGVQDQTSPLLRAVQEAGSLRGPGKCGCAGTCLGQSHAVEHPSGLGGDLLRLAGCDHEDRDTSHRLIDASVAFPHQIFQFGDE